MGSIPATTNSSLEKQHVKVAIVRETYAYVRFRGIHTAQCI